MKLITIIDAFITDPAEEKTLVNFIDSVKTIGDDLLLMSNTTIDKEVQKKVDYFFYDKRNQLFKEEYTNYDVVYYWNQYDTCKVYECFPHTQKHGLSVLISLYRSVKIAKELGYTHFYKMEYDAILGDETKNKIKDVHKYCEETGKKGVFYLSKNSDDTSIAVHYFFCEIDYFLNNFSNITNEQDFIDYLEHENGNRNFLTMERFMYENLKKLSVNDIDIRINFFEEFSDTGWNIKHCRNYFDEKYRECLTKFYFGYDMKNGGHLLKDEIVIYSRNIKSTPDYRRIVIKFNDGTEKELHHEFRGYGGWMYDVVNNNVEKMMVYKGDEFLYEDYFIDIKNKIEFF